MRSFSLIGWLALFSLASLATVVDAQPPRNRARDNLEKLPTAGATVVALPMKIGEGSGAPLRIIAIVPE